MKHVTPATGVSAADIERRLDKVAQCIQTLGPIEGRALVPLYQRYEQQLAAVRAADDIMHRVLRRLTG